MMLTCHEELGRVGRRCYEDARDLCETSRGCVGLVEFAERLDTRTNGQHYTADRPTNQVSARQAERGSRTTRTTRATSS